MVSAINDACSKNYKKNYMIIDDWVGIRQYQETHQALYEEAMNPTETLTDHLDSLCTIYNAADIARSTTFDTF